MTNFTKVPSSQIKYFDIQKIPEDFHEVFTPELSTVVRGGVGGALAPLEFGVSEKRTERYMESLLLSATPDLKT